MRVNQPSNQIKLTNVSVVRLKKGGKRFEIACYKNKVQEWRNGVETDLDDVLQISNVFINVSKGEVAKSEDLKKAFSTIDINVVVKEILKKGELQVGEKEREHDLATLRRDIANQVSEKCVDPATKRPYPIGIIEKAMNEVGFSVKLNKNAKTQALECIHLIQEKSKLPIERARMRVRVTTPIEVAKKVKEQIHLCADSVEVDEMGPNHWETILLIDPAQFRVINELLQAECKGRGRIDTLSLNATLET